MSTQTLDERVHLYLDAVRANLEDLPAKERDDLLEDLEQHLREVAAEDERGLVERLGPPDLYAAELRASAGLPGPPSASSFKRTAPGRVLAAVWTRPDVRSARGFFRELRPAWWVLRAYVIYTTFHGTPWDRSEIPIRSIADSQPLGAIVLLGAIWLSIKLGRQASERTPARWLSRLVDLWGVVALVALILVVQTAFARPAFSVPTYLHHADRAPITNICPYGEDGTLLEGVLLLDPDGRPVSNVLRASMFDASHAVIVRDGVEPAYRYPLEARELPEVRSFPEPEACAPSIELPPSVVTDDAVEPGPEEGDEDATQDSEEAPVDTEESPPDEAL